jgi:hypothetical protein
MTARYISHISPGSHCTRTPLATHKSDFEYTTRSIHYSLAGMSIFTPRRSLCILRVVHAPPHNQAVEVRSVYTSFSLVNRIYSVLYS